MSIHIGAKPGQVASTILLPGDPMRAKFFADTLLEDAFCFNEVRGMLGFTGTYQGKQVSVMGSGMGIPSISIYANELISDYGVKRLIRVGTCGALLPDLKVGDVLLAQAVSTDSNINRLHFGGMDYAPFASFNLLLKAYQAAKEQGVPVRVGGILSGDTFYMEGDDWWKVWAGHGIMAVEMESSALYTIAARLKVEALSILTVSDSLVTEERASSQQREQGFSRMAKLALSLAE